MEGNDKEGTLFPQMTLWTKRAIDKMKVGKPGDIITAEDMALAVGKPIHPASDGKSYGHSAIKHVRKHYQLDWAWVTGEGCWRCRTHEETLNQSIKTESRRIRSAGKRLRDKAMCIDETLLSEDEKAVLRAQTCIYVFADTITSTKTQKMLQENPSLSPPDPKQIMSVFE